MAQYQAFAKYVEVSGQSAQSVIEAMGMFKKMAVEILAKHGIPELNADQWYPQQNYLDFYRDIAERIGLKTLKTIGREVPNNALWPKEIDSLDKALASIDAAYHLNHRGGEIGSYRYEKTGERSAKIIANNPYPCPFDHGLIEGVAQKFAVSTARLRVVHDDTLPCRLNGAESCVYLISW